MGLEEQLCALLARYPLSMEAEPRARELLAHPVTWPRLMQLVRIHEILPLVHCSLKSLGFPGVPQPIQDELDRLFRHNALRNLLLAEELGRVLSALAAAHVPAMPLKGVALAESLYGDAALRVCADIDLLVPPQRFAAAFAVLGTAGYEVEFTSPQLVSLTARYGKDAGLMRQDGATLYPLQLHAGLIWGGPVERGRTDEIWSDARPVTFRGVPTFALSPEWEFLYLAVHAARHGLACMKWLADLDRLCRCESLRWEEVARKAERLGWSAVVQSALSAGHHYLKTPMPEYFGAAAAKDRGVKPPAALPAPHESSLHILNETLFAIRLLPSPAQKLQFLGIRLFIPTAADCRLVSLPAPLFFVYYALRPVRLILTVAGWLMRFVIAQTRRVGN